MGSDRVDRMNANHSRGGVQTPRDPHVLVEKVMRLSLIVELIGGAVEGGEDKSVTGSHNSSLERCC